MSCFLDSNLPLRWADRRSALRPTVVAAIRALRGRGEATVFSGQVVVEFWAVATRPLDVNGLGLTPQRTRQLVDRLEVLGTMLPDPPDLFPRWLDLVTTHQVSGKKVHDARLVAFMLGHGIGRILTFNVADFARYPGIVAIDPRDFVEVTP